MLPPGKGGGMFRYREEYHAKKQKTDPDAPYGGAVYCFCLLSSERPEEMKPY